MKEGSLPTRAADHTEPLQSHRYSETHTGNNSAENIVQYNISAQNSYRYIILVIRLE